MATSSYEHELDLLDLLRQKQVMMLYSVRILTPISTHVSRKRWAPHLSEVSTSF